MNQENNLIGTYSDFIGVYDNHVPLTFCEEIIEQFDYHQTVNSMVYCEDEQFENSSAGRFDWAIDLAHMTPRIGGIPERNLNEYLGSALDEYVHVFGHLKQMPFYNTTQKIQKTPAGGGYHVWHDEQSGPEFCTRAAVWMVYLNDNFEGGETEFLYYKRRIQPKAGTLLIWPSGLTHAHRGGLVLSGNKYVATGWFHHAYHNVDMRND